MNNYEEQIQWSFEELLTMLHSEDNTAQIVAMASLRDSDTPEAVDALLEMLDAADAEIVDYAIYSLGLMGERVKSGLLYTNIMTGLTNKLAHPEPFVRAGCLSAIRRAGDCSMREVFVPYLSDTDELVQLNAAQELAYLHDERSIPVLLKLLKHPLPSVRSSCVNALIHVAPVSEILANMSDVLNDSDMYVRQTAIEVLGKLGDPAAFDVIWVYIQNEVDQKPVQGAWALAQLGDTVFEPLIKKLNNSDPNIRYWATVALGQLGESRAIPFLTQLTEDHSQTRTRAQVASAAKKAIEKLQCKNKN